MESGFLPDVMIREAVSVFELFSGEYLRDDSLAARIFALTLSMVSEDSLGGDGLLDATVEMSEVCLMSAEGGGEAHLVAQGAVIFELLASGDETRCCWSGGTPSSGTQKRFSGGRLGNCSIMDHLWVGPATGVVWAAYERGMRRSHVP